jgi:hypothetical protein
LLLRTPRPEPVAELAGTQTAVQTTRYLAGRHTGQSSGVSTQREIPVVSPDNIRRLDVGQAAYLYRGDVTYLHVKPPAAAVADEAFTRIRATPALPWTPPRPALPCPRRVPRGPHACAAVGGQERHLESAIAQPLPRIQPAAESVPRPPMARESTAALPGKPMAFRQAFGESQT